MKIPSNVKVMAVTKNRSLSEIEKVISGGIQIVGENRIQEAETKFPHLNAEKHLIGLLQKNKAGKAVTLCDSIDCIDSEKLARKIDSECAKIDKKISVMIQINISREPQKGGVLPEKLDELIQLVSSLPHLKLTGLMAIAKDTGDTEEIRVQFAEMKALQKQYNLKELSIGMSQDYQIAIEEGSTMIRLGRALFD